MSRICQVTGRRVVKGFSVSHSNNKTKRDFAPNLQVKKFYLPEQDVWVELKVSARAIKTIAKKGLEAVLREGLY